MRCDGFNTEDYDAYALGTLESDRDLEIREHLNSNCETCLPRVKQSLHLWAIFGAAVAPDAERPSQGRVRVVPLIGKPGATDDKLGNLSAAAAQPKWHAWRGMAIAASLALVTGLTTWNLAYNSALSQAQQQDSNLHVALADANKETDRLRKELDSAGQESVNLKARAQQVTDLQALLSEREKQIQVLLRTRTDLTDKLQLAEARATEGSRILAALSLPNARLIPVPGTEVAPAATGYAVLAENNRVVFHANNLPPLPAGRVYQLWLIRGQAPQVVSGGVFTLSATRSAEVEFSQGSLIQSVQALAVTDEPAGGSPGPTGQKFLVGAVKS